MTVWQDELKNNVRTAQDLARHMPLDTDTRRRMALLLERFPMSITRYYLSLIDFDDPADPILKMAVPSVAETDLSGSFDTSGEASNTVIPGLQHKYAETVLMLSCNECAMYCRHCFRKRLVGVENDEVAQNLDAMRDYIRQHTEISNVLVSGGDALLNSNERLDRILSRLVDIGHLDVIRLGTRTPVVFPQRITGDAALLDMLRAYSEKKQLALVTQFNHPREITPESTLAVKLLLDIGLPVHNQAVLLRGVNDDAETLGTLMKRLTAIGAQPYYVFQCRPVKGVKNQFQVPLQQGWRIVRDAKAMQNGLGKSFRYCMSHVTGKMEILGPAAGDDMLFQYHEAKDPALLGTFHTQSIAENQAWLDDTQ